MTDLVYDCNVDSCDWTFGNGSDITGSPWEGIDLNFECTTDGPAGPYNQWAGGTGDFTAASAMNSTTSDNGLLLIDSDLFGADANYSAAWIENSWVQTTDPIDCSSLDFVSISFETRYRCWDNGSSDDAGCLIEISRGIAGQISRRLQKSTELLTTVTVNCEPLGFSQAKTGSSRTTPLWSFDIKTGWAARANLVRFRWSGTWGWLKS